LSTESQLPFAGHKVNLLGVIESAPHEPPEVAIARAMHLSSFVLQPTACATSHWLCVLHVSPICPATGTMHVESSVLHAKPLLHAPFTHALPAVLAGAHVPHCESAARAQNALVH
jgi:hypothetical protein